MKTGVEKVEDVNNEITEPEFTTNMAEDEETASTLKTTQEDVTIESAADANLHFVASDQAYATCYNNTMDFTLMMYEFRPAIQDYIHDYPHHEHSKQWCLWVEAGLNPETDLAKVKQITGLHTLDQIYLFLRDSPALQPFFDIVWDHKINYCQKNIMETPTRDNTYRQSRDDVHYVNFDHLPESFQPFHKLVFHLIHEQPTMVHVQRNNWDRWYRNGLRADTDLEDIYNISFRLHRLLPTLGSCASIPYLVRLSLSTGQKIEMAFTMGLSLHSLPLNILIRRRDITVFWIYPN
jgi:hypothetical protein